MPTDKTEKDEAKATHRLHRMIVQEVSLVDHAANKRRFLMTKRDETMPKPVKKEDAGTAAANVAADNTAAANTGDSGGMQAQVKEELTNALADAAEKIVAIANQIDGVTVTDQPATPPVPADITKQIGEIAASLVAISAKYGGQPTAAAAVSADANGAQPPAGSPAATAPAPAAKSSEEEDDEEKAVKAAEAELTAKGMKPAEHADVIAKSVASRLSIKLDAAQAVVKRVEVRKAGRRMAKERMERLGKAIDMLITILKELRYDNEKRARKVAEARTQKSANAGDVSKEMVDSLLTNSEQLVALTKTQADELTRAKTDLATANAKIAQLEKSVPTSNVRPSEGGAETQATRWPAWDMNEKRPATAR